MVVVGFRNADDISMWKTQKGETWASSSCRGDADKSQSKFARVGASIGDMRTSCGLELKKKATTLLSSTRIANEGASASKIRTYAKRRLKCATLNTAGD